MGAGISYLHWKEDYKSILQDLSNKKVIMMISGGKDSSVAMDLILRASKEFGYDFETHGGSFPLHRYTDVEKDKIHSYWASRGVEITWHKSAESDEPLYNAANPCQECQRLNKRALNNFVNQLFQDWTNFVVIAGYSLWDIVSYEIENILNNLYSIPDYEEGMRRERDRRLLETAQRFYPIFNSKEGFTVFRPVIKFNTNDIEKHLEEIGIPTISIPCKFEEFRPKRYLMQYYKKMGMEFDYAKVLSFSRDLPNFPDIDSYSSLRREEYFQRVF